MRQFIPDSRQTAGPVAPRNRKRVAIMLELEWPYRRHCDVYAGAQQYAQECGNWDCTLDEYADATLKNGPKMNPAYDGIIARVTPELAKQARRCRVPVVNVWFNSPNLTVLPGVFPDAAAMGKQAAEHLLERGFRRFACLSGRNDPFHKFGIDRFHQEIRNAGFQCQCAQVNRQYTSTRLVWQSFQRDLDRWVSSWKPPLAAYVTFPDAMGRHVADCCHRHNLVVPDDAALIVCDNEPALCLHPAPSLTSVDVSYHQNGYTAAEMLDQLMSGKKPAALHKLLPPTGIAARQSTDFFAVDDELVDTALRYISANVHRPIQVDDVSKGVFAGRRTLERRFRNVLHRTVAEEIIRLRIERAKRELAGTDTSIKLIAGRVGFRDAKRMHEIFLREIKMSPSQYRQSLRQP